MHDQLFDSVFKAIVRTDIAYKYRSKQFREDAAINLYLRTMREEVNHDLLEYLDKSRKDKYQNENLLCSASTYNNQKDKARAGGAWPENYRERFADMACFLFYYVWDELNKCSDSIIKNNMLEQLKRSIVGAVIKSFDHEGIDTQIEREYADDPVEFVKSTIHIALYEEWESTYLEKLIFSEKKNMDILLINADSEYADNELETLCRKLESSVNKAVGEESSDKIIIGCIRRGSNIKEDFGERDKKKILESDYVCFLIGNELSDKTQKLLSYVSNTFRERNIKVGLFQKEDSKHGMKGLLPVYSAAEKLETDIIRYHSIEEVFLFLIRDFIEYYRETDFSFSVRDKVLVMNGNDVLPLKNHYAYNNEILTNLRMQLEYYRVSVSKSVYDINELEEKIRLYENFMSQNLCLSLQKLDDKDSLYNQALHYMKVFDYEKAKAVLSREELETDLKSAKGMINVEKMRIKEYLKVKRLLVSTIKVTEPDNRKKIRKIYDELVDVSIDSGVDYSVILEYAEYLSDLGEYQDTLSELEKLIHLHDLYGDKRVKDIFEVYILNGEVLLNLHRYDEAAEQYMKAEEACRALENSRIIMIRCNVLAAKAYYYMAEDVKMEIPLERAELIARPAGYLLKKAKMSPQEREIIAEFNHYVGLLNSRLDKPDEAEQFYLRAIEHFNILLDGVEKESASENRILSTMSRTYNNIGVIYKKMKRFEDARDFYTKALNIRKVLYRDNPYKYEDDYTTVCINLGLNCLDRGDSDGALAYFKEVEGIRQRSFRNDREIGDRYPGALAKLGSTYRKIGDFEKAESILLEAYGLFELFDSNRRRWLYVSEANCLSELANVYKNMDNPSESRKYYDKVLQLWSDNREKNPRKADRYIEKIQSEFEDYFIARE